MAATAVNRGIYVGLVVLSGMAGLAIDNGVDPCEGEALGSVLFEKISPSLPILRGMAILTVQTKLTLVVIGMAIDAGCSDVAEDRVFVATGTLRHSVTSD